MSTIEFQNLLESTLSDEIMLKFKENGGHLTTLTASLLKEIGMNNYGNASLIVYYIFALSYLADKSSEIVLKSKAQA